MGKPLKLELSLNTNGHPVRPEPQSAIQRCCPDPQGNSAAAGGAATAAGATRCYIRASAGAGHGAAAAY